MSKGKLCESFLPSLFPPISTSSSPPFLEDTIKAGSALSFEEMILGVGWGWWGGGGRGKGVLGKLGAALRNLLNPRVQLRRSNGITYMPWSPSRRRFHYFLCDIYSLSGIPHPNTVTVGRKINEFNVRCYILWNRGAGEAHFQVLQDTRWQTGHRIYWDSAGKFVFTRRNRK